MVVRASVFIWVKTHPQNHNQGGTLLPWQLPRGTYRFQSPSSIHGVVLTHIDEVCRSGGMPVSTVSGTLTVMELKGLVKQVGNMNYVLTREAREEYGVKVD